MKRKRILLFLLMFVSVFVLSACNLNKNQKETNLLTEDFFKPNSVEELTEMVRYKEPKQGFFEKFFGYFNSMFTTEDTFINDSSPIGEPQDELTSTTNIQVEGVDEADSIKNDDRYIYFTDNNYIRVVDSVTDKMFSYQIDDFAAHEMYLANEYLVVIGTKLMDQDRDIVKPHYKRNFSFSIIMLDIKDVANIQEIRRIEIDNALLVSSRRVNDNYYFVLKNRYVFDSINDIAILPTYYDSVVGNKTLALENINVMGLENNYSYHNMIVSFNALKEEAAHVDSYVGSFGNLYSSLDNLYITNTQYNANTTNVTSQEILIIPWIGNLKNIITNIYRFEYEDDKVIYRHKTIVPGQIKDQFSMDEYQGNFRIVATAYPSTTETFAYNFVLSDEGFKLTSKVGQMGINEYVYSVRFENELCYVVTFRLVDPLYIVDFSDVDNIKVIGEFKTPGYSTYLYKYSDDLLIGVGDDATEEGQIIGGKISLFDVSDPDNITEPDIYKFDNYNRFYEGHKAIIVLREAGLFGLPMSDGSFYLFTIDEVNQTITLTKKITFYNPVVHDKPTRWLIRRGVIVNSKLYCIAMTDVLVTTLDTFESKVVK